MADINKEIALKITAQDATGPVLESLEKQLEEARQKMIELAKAGQQNTEAFKIAEQQVLALSKRLGAIPKDAKTRVAVDTTELVKLDNIVEDKVVQVDTVVDTSEASKLNAIPVEQTVEVNTAVNTGEISKLDAIPSEKIVEVDAIVDTSQVSKLDAIPSEKIVEIDAVVNTGEISKLDAIPTDKTVQVDTIVETTQVSKLDAIPTEKTVQVDAVVDTNEVSKLDAIPTEKTVLVDAVVDTGQVSKLDAIPTEKTVSVDAVVDTSEVSKLDVIPQSKTVEVDTQIDTSQVSKLDAIPANKTVDVETQVDTSQVAKLDQIPSTKQVKIEVEESELNASKLLLEAYNEELERMAAASQQGTVEFKNLAREAQKLQTKIETSVVVKVDDSKVKEFEDDLKDSPPQLPPIAPSEADQQNLVSAKSRLKALREEMIQLTVAGQQNTDRFRQLESQAGELADTIADTSQRIKNVGSDTRNIEAFTQAVQGVAAGFQLAQGAAGLFGQENEDVQKAILKVQSAMAIANGVQQIANLLQKESAVSIAANRIALALYDKTVKGTTISLKAFKVALATTGIGLLAVGIAVAYENWDKLRELLGLPPDNSKAIAALEREIAVMEAAGKPAEQINEKRRILIGLQAEQLKGQEKENKLNEIKVLNAQEQLAAITDQANTTQKLNSVDEASLEILKQKAGFYGSVAKSVNDLSSGQAILTITSKTSTDAVINASKELFENYQKGIEQQKAVASSQAEINQITIDEAIRVSGLLNEIEKQRIANDIQSGNEWNDFWLKERATELQALQQGNLEQTQILENRRAAALSLAALALGDTEAYRAKEAEINQQYNDLQANQDAIYAEKKKQLKAQERDTTIKFAGEAFTGILSLGEAMMGSSEEDARKAFNLNKAASIADATVNTFLAATQALRDPKLPTVAKAFAVGGIIASGLAQVRKIAATQFKASGSSGGGGGGGTGPTGQAASQPSEIFANPQTTMLGTDGAAMSQGQNTAPMRAYVVERDISQSTRRVRRLEEFATIGG